MLGLEREEGKREARMKVGVAGTSDERGENGVLWSGVEVILDERGGRAEEVGVAGDGGGGDDGLNSTPL